MNLNFPPFHCSTIEKGHFPEDPHLAGLALGVKVAVPAVRQDHEPDAERGEGEVDEEEVEVAEHVLRPLAPAARVPRAVRAANQGITKLRS